MSADSAVERLQQLRYPSRATVVARLDQHGVQPRVALGGLELHRRVREEAADRLVALHADRLAHRQYQVVRTVFFEHVLQLPLTYYTGSHSGRLVKVMMTGTNTLWGLWLSFFREHFASFVSLIVLLPLTLFLNWRLALVLIALVGFFLLMTALVVRKTETAQRKVEGLNSSLAGTAQDALTNVMVVQSFTRLSAEGRLFGDIANQVIRHQFPVLNWWALVNVMTRASATASSAAGR